MATKNIENWLFSTIPLLLTLPRMRTLANIRI